MIVDMVNMIIDMKKTMAKLLVDIPDSLHKRIKHQAIDEDVSVKDLVTNILDDNIKDSGMSNVEKLIGKKKK